MLLGVFSACTCEWEYIKIFYMVTCCCCWKCSCDVIVVISVTSSKNFNAQQYSFEIWYTYEILCCCGLCDTLHRTEANTLSTKNKHLLNKNNIKCIKLLPMIWKPECTWLPFTLKKINKNKKHMQQQQQ